jgi:hypothetical protein
MTTYRTHAHTHTNTLTHTHAHTHTRTHTHAYTHNLQAVACTPHEAGSAGTALTTLRAWQARVEQGSAAIAAAAANALIVDPSLSGCGGDHVQRASSDAATGLQVSFMWSGISIGWIWGFQLLAGVRGLHCPARSYRGKRALSTLILCCRF